MASRELALGLLGAIYRPMASTTALVCQTLTSIQLLLRLTSGFSRLLFMCCYFGLVEHFSYLCQTSALAPAALAGPFAARRGSGFNTNQSSPVVIAPGLVAFWNVLDLSAGSRGPCPCPTLRRPVLVNITGRA
jgi:hypothetical protein